MIALVWVVGFGLVVFVGCASGVVSFVLGYIWFWFEFLLGLCGCSWWLGWQFCFGFRVFVLRFAFCVDFGCVKVRICGSIRRRLWCGCLRCVSLVYCALLHLVV